MKDIWIYELKNHKKIKKTLLNLIDDTEGNCYVDNVNKITKTDYFHAFNSQTKDYVKLLHENLHEFYDSMSDTYCLGEFRYGDVWYQQYFKNDTHTWHVHGGSNISFVYFLELKEKEQITEFYNSKDKKIFYPNAKEGDILVFPSYIPHRSPIIKSKNRKTIISANLHFKNLDLQKILIENE